MLRKCYVTLENLLVEQWFCLLIFFIVFLRTMDFIVPILIVLCKPRACTKTGHSGPPPRAAPERNYKSLLLCLLVKFALPVCLSILGGFYSDVVGHVGTSCMKCPNGSFVAYNNAPGTQAQDWKSCPLGKNNHPLNYLIYNYHRHYHH